MLIYARAWAQHDAAREAGHPTAPHVAALEKAELGLVDAVGRSRADATKGALERAPDIGAELLRSRQLPIPERDRAVDRGLDRLRDVAANEGRLRALDRLRDANGGRERSAEQSRDLGRERSRGRDDGLDHSL